MELNFYNVFNVLYLFIVDNEMGVFRGNIFECVLICFEIVRVIMLLLCVYYDLLFVNWIINFWINFNVFMFFLLDSFMFLI